MFTTESTEHSEVDRNSFDLFVERWFDRERMEITGINTIQTLKTVGTKSLTQTAHVEDTITISAEAKKHAEWVDMLKAMPDVRPDNIAAALSHPPISAAALAEHLVQLGF